LKNITVPAIPNKVLLSNSSIMPLGEISLVQNIKNELVQNCKYNSKILTFDESYQNAVLSPVFINHMNEIYIYLKKHFKKNSVLVEVGCGKGQFLEIVRDDKHFIYFGFDTTYEGADQNIQKRYLNKNDKLSADVVIIRHSLDYVEAPHKFLNMLKNIFDPQCKVFIELPNFSWIKKEKVIFDLTPERVSYFTKNALCNMFKRVVEHKFIFSNQYQFILANFRDLEDQYEDDFSSSNSWININLLPFFSSFKRFAKNTSEINFKRIWVWGGGSRGVLFLHHLKSFDKKLYKKISGLVDINPKRQNCFTPSTLIKIISPYALYRHLDKNDIVLIVNANYFEEIKMDILRNTSFEPYFLKL